MDPERVDRVDRELFPLRVDGVRPEPVRVEPVLTRPLPVPPAAPAPAMPQTLQYPSSIVPVQLGCVQRPLDVVPGPLEVLGPLGAAGGAAARAVDAATGAAIPQVLQ
jgi:hypothetical protein